MRRQHTPLGGGDSGHLGVRPTVQLPQLLSVRRGTVTINGGVSRIDTGQGIREVLHVENAIMRKHPRMLIEYRGLGLATHRMLVFLAERLDAAADDDLCA